MNQGGNVSPKFIEGIDILYLHPLVLKHKGHKTCAELLSIGEETAGFALAMGTFCLRLPPAVHLYVIL
jgi:hypothetical protein